MLLAESHIYPNCLKFGFGYDVMSIRHPSALHFRRKPQKGSSVVRVCIIAELSAKSRVIVVGKVKRCRIYREKYSRISLRLLNEILWCWPTVTLCETVLAFFMNGKSNTHP